MCLFQTRLRTHSVKYNGSRQLGVSISHRTVSGNGLLQDQCGHYALETKPSHASDDPEKLKILPQLLQPRAVRRLELARLLLLGLLEVAAPARQQVDLLGAPVARL